MDTPTMVQTEDERRFYEVGGRRLPSVTTILRATEGYRYGLEKWKADLGEEAAELARQASANRGIRLEAQIDAFLFEDTRPEDEADVWWCSVLPELELLRATATKLQRQVVLVNEVDGYAGTADLTYEVLVEGVARPKLRDWKSKSSRDKKTGKVRKPSRSKIVDNLLQVAAYCEAWAMIHGERPDGEVAIALPDRQCLVFPVLPEDLAAWRGRLAQYEAQTATDAERE